MGGFPFMFGFNGCLMCCLEVRGVNCAFSEIYEICADVRWWVLKFGFKVVGTFSDVSL